MIIFIKIIIYSIFGYYLINLYSFIFNKKIKLNYFGVIFPLYSLFLLSNKLFISKSLILIYIIGIITGLFIKNIYYLYNGKILNIHILHFGIFNLFNRLILATFIKHFIISSTKESLTILFIALIIPYVFDLTLSMRKNLINL